MHDGLEVASGRGVGEDDAGERLAVELTARTEHVRAEPLDDRVVTWRSGFDRPTREGVGVEDDGAALLEHARDGGLARADPAGEADEEHRSTPSGLRDASGPPGSPRARRPLPAVPPPRAPSRNRPPRASRSRLRRAYRSQRGQRLRRKRGRPRLKPTLRHQQLPPPAERSRARPKRAAQRKLQAKPPPPQPGRPLLRSPFPSASEVHRRPDASTGSRGGGRPRPR